MVRVSVWVCPRSWGKDLMGVQNLEEDRRSLTKKIRGTVGEKSGEGKRKVSYRKAPERRPQARNFASAQHRKNNQQRAGDGNKGPQDVSVQAMRCAMAPITSLPAHGAAGTTTKPTQNNCKQIVSGLLTFEVRCSDVEDVSVQ